MSEELESIQSDVSPEVSSEPQSSSNEGGEASQQASGSSKEADNAPFHEHPRFKELINQKNEFASKLKDYESRFDQMSKELQALRQPKVEEPKVDRAKMLERLKGIDPEFAAYQQTLMKELEELRGWRDMSVQERTQMEVQGTISKLHQEHKVDNPQLQEWYKTELKAMADANPNLGVKDIPNMYKAVHDKISKFFEARDKATIASYANQKKSAAQVPSPSKGQAPKPNAPKKVQYSRDPEEARAQKASRILNAIRANNDN